MDNLRFYEAGRAVPPEAQKEFNNGRFKGTDINPMWRIKKLTEMFGPCGIGWYVEVLSERSEPLDNDTVISIVDLNLFVRMDGEWSKPIYGTGGNLLRSKGKNGIITSDEGYKMAYTDALGVACKALGIGADVYWSKDTSKYTHKPTEAPAQPEKPARTEKRMATEEQRQTIIDTADDQTYANAMNAFGPDLERMSFAQAQKLIDRINGGV